MKKLILLLMSCFFLISCSFAKEFDECEKHLKTHFINVKTFEITKAIGYKTDKPKKEDAEDFLYSKFEGGYIFKINITYRKGFGVLVKNTVFVYDLYGHVGCTLCENSYSSASEIYERYSKYDENRIFYKN